MKINYAIYDCPTATGFMPCLITSLVSWNEGGRGRISELIVLYINVYRVSGKWVVLFQYKTYWITRKSYIYVLWTLEEIWGFSTLNFASHPKFQPLSKCASLFYQLLKLNLSAGEFFFKVMLRADTAAGRRKNRIKVKICRNLHSLCGIRALYSILNLMWYSRRA